MGWFFRKKKVSKTKIEIQVLEQVEDKIEKQEIKYCELALKAFTEAGNTCYFDTRTSRERGWIALNSSAHIRNIRAFIEETTRNILNLKGYIKKHVKLASQIEADLLDIRDGVQDKKADFLSNSEIRVITFGKDIASHVAQLAEQCKKLLLYDFEKVRNIEYMTPENIELGKQIRNDMLEIQRGLNGLHKMLLDLFELERKVEELTEAYIKS